MKLKHSISKISDWPEVEDEGLYTALNSMGNGIIADEVIQFNNELEQKGYRLTTYFVPNLCRLWAIYKNNGPRPSRCKNCLIVGKQKFNSMSCKTQKSAAFLALSKIKKDFTDFGKKIRIHENDQNIPKKLSLFSNDLKELRELINNEESSKAIKAIEKLKKFNSNELENTILHKVGYKKPELWSVGHLYLKHDSIFKPTFKDSEHVRRNIWFFILFIIGYSRCKAAISLKNRITSLEFIRHEDLLYIPAEIKYFLNLKSLSFRGLHIETLPDEIGELENLEILDLEFTKLTSLPSTLGNLKKLKELKLFYCNLKSKPEELDNIEALVISGFDPKIIEKTSLMK